MNTIYTCNCPGCKTKDKQDRLPNYTLVILNADWGSPQCGHCPPVKHPVNPLWALVEAILYAARFLN